jgi:nucleotide-binding universal stress UspA family protein
MSATILVAVDFEAPSLAALDFAERIAPCLHAEIVLLHAYPLIVRTTPSVSPIGPAPSAGIHLEVTAAARSALDQLAAERGGLRSILTEGDPARAILDEIARLTPLLVVLGTRTRTGRQRLRTDSVSAKVARASTAPVTLVRAPSSDRSAA